jgi:hypothetical protein
MRKKSGKSSFVVRLMREDAKQENLPARKPRPRRRQKPLLLLRVKMQCKQNLLMLLPRK